MHTSHFFTLDNSLIRLATLHTHAAIVMDHPDSTRLFRAMVT